MSEIITILIAFQSRNYRTFKHVYRYLLVHHRREFPRLAAYRRFVAMMPLFA